MKKRILIICRGHLQKEPRFIMEVEALKDKYELTAAGLSGAPDGFYRFIDIGYKGKLNNKPINFHRNYPGPVRKIFSFFIRAYMLAKKSNRKRVENFGHQELKHVPFDLLIVHHLEDIPLAFRLNKNKAPIIFNAHEYYPLEFEENPQWMQSTFLAYDKVAKIYLKKVDACFCVGRVIAEKYMSEYAMSSYVVTNAKKFYAIEPKPVTKEKKIRLIHHGVASPSRKIERIIEVMNHLDQRFELDLILVPVDKEYFEKLISLSKKIKRVKLVPPVTTEEIPRFLNEYDIGLYILAPSNFNNLNALPNKFFEFIQGRLALAIGPSPEMKEIVSRYDLGVIADDFTTEAMAEKLNALTTDQINYYKNQSHKHAGELSIENNYRVIRETIEKLLN